VGGAAIFVRMSESKFRMTIQDRSGRYGYVITRIDKPDWAEASLDTFDSVDDAAVAAGDALERHRRSEPQTSS
jgi:hypothetical protein